MQKALFFSLLGCAVVMVLTLLADGSVTESSKSDSQASRKEVGGFSQQANNESVNKPTTNKIYTRRRLNKEEIPEAVRKVLDQKTDQRERFYLVWSLATSGYRPESAKALIKIAIDPNQEETTRGYAAMGLSNYASALPNTVRQSIRKRLQESLRTEKHKLPPHIMMTLVRLGDADLVAKLLGEKLYGHRMEFEILKAISSREIAISRLMEMYTQSGAVTTKEGWQKRWYVGDALIARRDNRGIDILIECLSVKEPWPFQSSTPNFQKRELDSFRQCLHNTFAFIACTIDEDFGYGEGGTWRPQLNEAIPKMVDWWKANREKFIFMVARSKVVPMIDPGKPLTKWQARVWAAKLATDAFANANFRQFFGMTVEKIDIGPGSFNHVEIKNGRWILKMARKVGPQCSIHFNLDGTDEKVYIEYFLM